MRSFDELSEEEKSEFIRRYYEGENINETKKRFDVSGTMNRIINLFPPEEIDRRCDYCGSHLFRRRLLRDSYHKLGREDVFCIRCHHFPLIKNCRCAECKARELDKINKAKQRIVEEYSQYEEPVDITQLDFTTRVYLGALIRSCVNEDLFYVHPYNKTLKRLAPTDSMAEKIYKHLINQKVIVVDPSSSIGCFNLDSEKFPKEYSVFDVTYNLNILYPNNKKELLNEILYPDFYSSEHLEMAFDLWKEIATYECIEFLQYHLDKVHFDFSPGDKTYATFDGMLNVFSVSQIYCIIWRAVRDACHYYQKGNVSTNHAANSAVYNCRRISDNIMRNGWHVSDFTRPHDILQSEISLYFYNAVVKIGDRGLSVAPNLDDLGIEKLKEIELKDDESKWDGSN